ncbi:glycine-rich cell wall structural protein 1.8 [Drosophila madeirensis]|uniref:Glycine-rich cell wall structural protein 1.8 n=1 Tax=Drosophila madeirensis TaxID=30013 RepID=A0AAU9FV18_DROMD
MKCFFVLVAASLMLSSVWAEDTAALEPAADAPLADQDQVSAASNYAPLQEKKQEKRYVGGYGGYGGYSGYGGGGYGSPLGAGYGGAYGAAGYGSGVGLGAGAGLGVDSYYNPYSSRSLGGLGEDGSAVAGYGGYGSALGGYGSALGGYGSSLGGYGSSLGGYGSSLGGYGSGLGGVGGYGSYNSNPYALSSYYNGRGLGSGIGTGTGYPYYNTRFGAGGYPSSYYTSNYGNSVVGGGLGALAGGVPPIGSGYNYGAGISGTVY